MPITPEPSSCSGCSGGCNCAVTAGDGITVTGVGSPGDPFVVTADAVPAPFPQVARFNWAPGDTTVNPDSLSINPLSLVSDPDGLVNLADPINPNLVSAGVYAITAMARSTDPVTAGSCLAMEIFGVGLTFWEGTAEFLQGHIPFAAGSSVVVQVGAAAVMRFQVRNTDLLNPMTSSMSVCVVRLA